MARSMEYAPWPSRTGWTPRHKDGANASWRGGRARATGRHIERRSKRCRRSPRRAPRRSSDTGPWRIDTRTSTATRSTSCRSARTSTGRRCSGLPDDSCQCPHWGYVLKGELTFRFADREEVFEAGDAFYLPPGHVPLGARPAASTSSSAPREELRRSPRRWRGTCRRCRRLSARSGRRPPRTPPRGAGRAASRTGSPSRGSRRRSSRRCARRGWRRSWARSRGARRSPCSTARARAA